MTATTIEQSVDVNLRLLAGSFRHDASRVTLTEVEHALGIGLLCAYEALRIDVDKVAEHVLAGDPEARAEFMGDAGMVAGYLRNCLALAKGPRIDARPFTLAELQDLNARTRAPRLAPTPPAPTAAPAPAAVTGPPSIAELARRCGVKGEAPVTFDELWHRAKLRRCAIDGVRDFGWHLRAIAGSPEAALKLNADLAEAEDVANAAEEAERRGRTEARRLARLVLGQ
ncbi:MAG: hypothetical protein ABIP94_25115 [Planctomycetota bacterium]